MNVLMGKVLNQPELPANSPRPPETPQEGIIAVDHDGDGVTRKYLYKAIGGNVSEMLISESETALPTSAPVSRSAATPVASNPKVVSSGYQIASEKSSLGFVAEAKKRLAATPMGREKKAETIQVQEARGPQIGKTMEIPGLSQNRPALSRNALVPVDTSVMGDKKAVPMTSMAPPLSFLENSVKVVEKTEMSLGHVPQKQITPGTPLGIYQPAERRLGQTTQAAPAPAAQDNGVGKCPGAIEMPDGKVINPEDSITLEMMCELMPFLLDSYSALQAKKEGPISPGQNVPVVGQNPQGNGLVPSTQSQFGPAGGVQRGGGGGFVGSGGGGPGPAGPPGPVGPVGPPGPGVVIEPPIRKTDGNFSASAGAFIPVPGTLFLWTQSVASPAEVKVIVTLGDGSLQTCENAQLGIRVDGQDFPLTVRSIHTAAGGVGEFDIGQPLIFPTDSLAAGPHQAELLLRGLLPGEFGGGTGQEASVNASAEIPLVIWVTHR